MNEAKDFMRCLAWHELYLGELWMHKAHQALYPQHYATNDYTAIRQDLCNFVDTMDDLKIVCEAGGLNFIQVINYCNPVVKNFIFKRQ